MTQSNNIPTGYDRFRIFLDIIMGIVYLGLGGLIYVKKSFGTIELAPVAIYGMAGLLVIYGIFRIVLGYRKWKRA